MEATMEVINVKAKIEKLQRMAATTGPESDNAKRLIQKLLDKYKLTPDQLQEPKKWITYKLHRLKKYGIHLSCWMGMEWRAVGGAPDYIAIHADPDEYLMFHELLDEIKHQFNKKETQYTREAREQYSEYPAKSQLTWKNNALKSFMQGYMNTNYAYDRLLCPTCKKGHLVLHENIKRYRCPECAASYGYTQYQGHKKVESAFTEGINTTTKAIKVERLRLA
jgi:ribosomal protein L37AE/L43A